MLRKLANKKLGSFIHQILLAVLGLASIALVARLFPTEIAASWIVCISVFALLDQLRAGWFQQGLMRALNGPDAENEVQYLRVALWGSFTFSLLLAVIGGICLIIPEFPEKHLVLPLIVAVLGSSSHVVLSWKWQAKSQFHFFWVYRYAIQIPIVATIGLAFVFDYMQIQVLIWAFACIHIAISIVYLILQFLPSSYWKFPSRTDINNQLHFGKYAVITLVGSNLLRSSDTFLLAALSTPRVVVIYGIAMRFLEVIEIPIRSILTIELPILAKLTQVNDKQQLTQYIEKHIAKQGVFIMLLCIVVAICAPIGVWMLAGSAYPEATTLVQIFMVFMSFVLFERVGGVSLDMIGLPQWNAIKVLLMLVVNIIGDLLALTFLPEYQAMYAVAAVSVATFGTGLVVGYWKLGQYVPVSILSVFKNSISSSLQIVQRWRK